MAETGLAVTDQMLELVRRKYPGWSGFADPRFENDERAYKVEASVWARENLAREALEPLLRDERFGEILDRVRKAAGKTNLLYRAAPASGDLAILHREGVGPQEVARLLFDLLHGAGDSAERLDRFVAAVEERDLPARWPLPTYLLFLMNPEQDFFVKPSVTTWWLGLLGEKSVYRPRPSGEAYRRMLQLLADLHGELEPYRPRDVIDLQSFLWVAQQAGQGPVIDPRKVRELEELFEEFRGSYLQSDQGRRHLATYEVYRRDIPQRLEALLERRARGEDVTDEVLTGLLPHTDSARHRESGAWIHIAPAISGDVRSWYEARDPSRSEDWPRVAEAIVELLRRCRDEPRDLAAHCSWFADQAYTKGFQSGMLSPALAALRPDDFLLVNSKPRLLFNHMAGTSWGGSLREYPDLNRIGWAVVDHLSSVLETEASDEAHSQDVLDTFSHWLVAIRHFPLGKTRYWKVAPGERARLWDEAREGGYIGIGWEKMGDLSGLDRAQFEAKRDALAQVDPEYNRVGLEQLWRFAHIQEGDKIIANEGLGRVVGIGTVVGPYHFVPDVEYGHRLPVDWEDTRPRQIETEGGWRRTLIELDREKFQKIVSMEPENPPEEEVRKPPAPSDGGFGPATFELLASLRESPTRITYQNRREHFQEHVEQPLQELLTAVVEHLPEEMTRRLESEKNLFSRITKNDYGRGGAWPFYWGALYPRGGRRIEGAQLFVWIGHQRLEAGFAIGQYGSEASERFVRNLERHRPLLPDLLRDVVRDPELWFGRRDEYEDAATGRLRDERPMDGLEWLGKAEEAGVQVTRVYRTPELLGRGGEALAGEVAELFRRLFPLVLLAVSEDPLPEIRRFVDDSVGEGEHQPAYPLAEVGERTGVAIDTLTRWRRAIERKKQAIFYGPPGTGKTFLAQELARHLVADSDGFVELVQFHPSYSYEDFLEGIRPEPRPGAGGLDYPVKPGRFLLFCERARRSTGTCVLIVDEINRANLSRVFGELMFLLEYRDESVRLAVSGRPFSIPENVRLLGTMNTADRSIALVDHALRRRFAFIGLAPDFDLLVRWHKDLKTSFPIESLVEVLRALNQRIDSPDHAVGVSFFFREDLAESIGEIWEMEIDPYLQEIFFDRPEHAREYRWASVAGKLDL